jgi:hypothetical protein
VLSPKNEQAGEGGIPEGKTKSEDGR